MTNTYRNMLSESGSKIRNVIFVLLAMGPFLLKSRYTGPFQELIYSYAGNICVSFAVYFIISNLRIRHRSRTLIVAALSLACVESFEVFDGFGFMSNTYDPFDLLANAIGVACALGLDTVLSKDRSRTSDTNS